MANSRQKQILSFKKTQPLTLPKPQPPQAAAAWPPVSGHCNKRIYRVNYLKIEYEKHSIWSYSLVINLFIL